MNEALAHRRGALTLRTTEVELPDEPAVWSKTDIAIPRPRALVNPRNVISKKTLSVLNESMVNLQAGRVGEPIDLTAFEVADEKTKSLPKKSASTKNGRSL